MLHGRSGPWVGTRVLRTGAHEDSHRSTCQTRGVSSSPTLPARWAALVAEARDETLPRVRRVRALTVLERAPVDLAHDVARALVPLLGAEPDLAARAHVALLVLHPGLRVARDDDGAFVGVGDGDGDIIDDGLGGFIDGRGRRAVALDALAGLFGPDDDVPRFLTPPPTPPLPPAYRSPLVEREAALQRELRRRATDRAALLVRLALLGLDDDDLDDDVDESPRRRRSPRPLSALPREATLAHDVDVVLVQGDARGVLGRGRAGAWWHEERAGDHRGARRFVLGRRLDVVTAPLQTRRELAVAGGRVSFELGDQVVRVDVAGRSGVVFVDTDTATGDIVAVSVTWSTPGAFKPGTSTDLRAKPRPRL